MMKTLYTYFILMLIICNHPEGDLTDKHVMILQNTTKQGLSHVKNFFLLAPNFDTFLRFSNL